MTDTWWFIYRGSDLFIQTSSTGNQVPCRADIPELGVKPLLQHRIGALGEKPCVAVEVPADTELPDGFIALGLRAAAGQLPADQYKLAGRGVQIVEWARTHRYCGRCGTPTVLNEAEGSMDCPSCGYAAFPRISPAVIVLIRDGKRCLLARNRRFPPGRFSTIAGFVEAGETLEETVAREVGEEVGVRIKNIRYFDSQPWPFPHSLMIGFTADYDGGEIKVQESEIAEAYWFTPESMPDLPPAFTIARRLINGFLDECKRAGV